MRKEDGEKVAVEGERKRIRKNERNREKHSVENM